jgi:hypothetical protein
MACDSVNSELLVSLVEKRPSIFDYNDKHHSNRVVQDKLWQEISLEMNCDSNYIKYYIILYIILILLFHMVYLLHSIVII